MIICSFLKPRSIIRLMKSHWTFFIFLQSHFKFILNFLFFVWLSFPNVTIIPFRNLLSLNWFTFITLSTFLKIGISNTFKLYWCFIVFSYFSNTKISIRYNRFGVFISIYFKLGCITTSLRSTTFEHTSIKIISSWRLVGKMLFKTFIFLYLIFHFMFHIH